MVWWVVGNLHGNVGVAVSRQQKLPGAPPLGESLEAAWQMSWKWRRLESLENIQLITHKTILCYHYPQLPNMACKAGSGIWTLLLSPAPPDTWRSSQSEHLPAPYTGTISLALAFT